MKRRIPVGPLLGALGALLLAVSLFLDWWDDLTAFTVFEVLDLLLLGLALATIASLAAGLGLVRAAPRPVTSLIVSLTALVIVVSQLLNDPPAVAGSDRPHEIGIWLALAGAALMAAGALLAWAHISLSVDVRPREPRRQPSPGSEAPTHSEAPTVREPARPVDDPERP
jgi:hypothetical protein